MADLYLRGIPARLYATLKKSARDQKRSLNNEVLFRLEQAYGLRPADCPEPAAQEPSGKRPRTNER